MQWSHRFFSEQSSGRVQYKYCDEYLFNKFVAGIGVFFSESSMLKRDFAEIHSGKYVSFFSEQLLTITRKFLKLLLIPLNSIAFSCRTTNNNHTGSISIQKKSFKNNGSIPNIMMTTLRYYFVLQLSHNTPENSRKLLLRRKIAANRIIKKRFFLFP